MPQAMITHSCHVCKISSNKECYYYWRFMLGVTPDSPDSPEAPVETGAPHKNESSTREELPSPESQTS